MPDFLQPTLVGKRLLLRPLKSDDRNLLFDVASDPMVWELHTARQRHVRATFDLLFDDAMQSGGTLAVFDRQSGKIIGSSRFSMQFCEADEVEIGWTFLSRDYWGGPTNREMKRLMLSHALQYRPRVIFRIATDNMRSRRAIEKIGATLTERTQIAKVEDRDVVHVVYAIDRDDFFASALSREEG